MKYALLFCVIACFYSGISAKEDEMRFIRFNESYAQWMTVQEVEKMVEECGISPHTGFMDITMTPDVVHPKPQRDVKIPVHPRHQQLVHRLKQNIQSINIWNTIDDLAAYNNRYYTAQTGVEAVAFLDSEYRRIAGNRLGVDIHVVRWDHTWAQPSVVAEIRGNRLPNERVVIGGHIDSTAGGAGARAPGADDDASGSSTVLEIFRVLASDPTFKPERTIEFQAYAAEEVGLRGSQDIARYYSDYNYNVVGMLQLDMTGYTGSSRVVGVVTDYTTATLTTFVRNCIHEYCNIPARDTACGYGCSDHASWYNMGYPAAFIFETIFSGSNPNIHTNRDTINHLNEAHATEFAYLGLGFVVEMSFAETTEIVN